MAKLSTKDRNKLDDSDFGLPDKRAYPLNDEEHIESAVRLFGHCPDEDKPRLAKAILRRARELGMDSSGWDKVNEWANKKVDKSIQEASIIESDEPGDHKVTFKVIKNAISKIHDKYKKDSKPPTGNQNCLLCAWCFLADWYGRILPRAVYSPRDPALDIKPEDMLIGKVHKVKASDKRELLKRISDLSKHDELAFWYCHVGWKDCTGGHEFVILNTWNEGTFVIDPQQGLFADVTSKEGRKYFDDADYSRTYAVRAEGFGHAKNINIDKLKEINSVDKIIQWDNKKDTLYLLEYQGMSKDDLIWSIEQGWITVDDLKELLDEGKIHDDTVETVREVIGKYESKVKQESATGINLTLKKATTRDIDFIYMCEMMTLTKREQWESKSKVNQEIMDDAKESVGNTYIIMVDGEYAGIYQGYKTDEWLISKPKGDWWYLAEIVVLPQYRGSGIGSTIIKEAMSEHDKIGLCVYEENVNAKRLYDRLGFKVTQHVDDEYGRRFIMRWERDKQRDYGDETINLDSYKHNKVYFGSTNKVGKRLKINKQLFITPYKGIASIFAAEDPVKKKLRELKVYSSNLEYDEWKKLSDRPYKTVHVKVKIHEGQPFEKFEVTGKGYIYGIDISGLKDNIYMYPWMDKTREALIMDVDSVDIDSVDEVEVKYIVEMVGEPEKVVEESYEMIQEGTTYRDKHFRKLYFHVSGDEYLDGQVFKPRVPSYIEPGDTADTSTEFEDATIPRVCFSPTIEGAMNAIICKINPQYPVPYKRLAVYIPEKPFNDYKHKTNKEIIKEKLVFDASSTGEVWIMEPVRMKLFGIIEIDSYKRAKMVSNVKNNKGERSQKKYFIFKWHWLVNPKIFDDKNRPKYDVNSVITNLCYELPKFKYGLIKDGKVTNNASGFDYDKYWVVHTGEEVDKAGGGNCYDMVEYEAGYLEAYGIPCKKYFLAMQYKNKHRTHTFIVVENNGKYIYIEGAFKRVIDEIGYSKEFDNLNDIFDYVLECSCEFDNVPEFAYGIFDYTDDTPTPGTPIQNFEKYIADNGKLVREGTFKFKKKE